MWNRISAGRWEYWQADRLVGGFFCIGDGIFECWTPSQRFYRFGPVTIDGLMREVQRAL